MKLTLECKWFKMEYTWSWALLKRRVKCLFRHDWEHHHGLIKVEEQGIPTDVVLGYKICKRCAHSKITHILS